MSKTIMTSVIKLPLPFSTCKSHHMAIQNSQGSLSSGKGRRKNIYINSCATKQFSIELVNQFLNMFKVSKNNFRILY